MAVSFSMEIVLGEVSVSVQIGAVWRISVEKSQICVFNPTHWYGVLTLNLSGHFLHYMKNSIQIFNLLVLWNTKWKLDQISSSREKLLFKKLYFVKTHVCYKDHNEKITIQFLLHIHIQWQTCKVSFLSTANNCEWREIKLKGCS